MKHSFLVILFLCLARFAAASNPLNSNPLNLEDIILDIYNATSELGETDYEQLQTDLYALHDAPIDLNHTSDEELSLLHFLSPQQIDEILAYADKHPFGSLYELRMIQSLADYEIRDLLPFVTLTSNPLNSNPLNVISGDDGIACDVMEAGGAGLISVASNAFPEDFHAIVHQKDQAKQAQYQEMIRLLFAEGNPVGIKAVLSQKGLIQNYLRLPLVPASKDLQERIRGLEVRG